MQKIMPTKDEHGCDSGSESLDKREPRDILHCHVERPYQRSLLQKGQNDRIKNIVSIFYGIQGDAKLSLLQEVVTHVAELRKPPYCMTISVCP
jgi:hypothetical protein